MLTSLEEEHAEDKRIAIVKEGFSKDGQVFCHNLQTSASFRICESRFILSSTYRQIGRESRHY